MNYSFSVTTGVNYCRATSSKIWLMTPRVILVLYASYPPILEAIPEANSPSVPFKVYFVPS